MAVDKKKIQENNDQVQQLLDLSKEHDVHYNFTVYTLRLIKVELDEREAGEVFDIAKFTKRMIRQLYHTHRTNLREKMLLFGIDSSDKLGELIYEFCEKGHIVGEKDELLKGFKGLFETEHIEAYVLANDLQKKAKEEDKYKRYDQVNLGLFGVGALAIVFVYNHILPFPFVWVASFFLLIAWGMSSFSKRLKPFLSEKIGL